MALEDITSKIAAKANREAERILDEVRRECEELRTEAQSGIEKRTAAALERATAEAASAEERLVAAAELDAKKRELTARQEAITAVLDKAIEALAEADEVTYVALLQTMLRQASFDGEADLFVSKKDYGLVQRNLATLQGAIDQAGSSLKLKLSQEPRELGGGFVLRQGKIEFNASPSSIKRSREEELRAAASEILFADEGSL